MEKENLNNVLGVEANSETTSKFVKTGRKFIYLLFLYLCEY